MKRDSFINFSSSHLLWETKSGSTGRFQIESITEIFDDVFSEKIYLLHAVMACDVYGKEPLFHDPAYVYEAAFSEKKMKIFRTYQHKTDSSVNLIDDLFKKNALLERTGFYREISTISELSEAISGGESLIGQLFYMSTENRSIKITFPIKHINISQLLQQFQVETGKVLYYQDSLENAQVAYIAFKSFDTINFLILDGYKNKIISLKAKISIYAKCK